VARRTHDGGYDLAYAHPAVGDDGRRLETDVFDRLAGLTDQPLEDVEADFHRKHRYVEYLQREGITDGDELFAFLADLETDEAATVERIKQPRSGRRTGGDDRARQSGVVRTEGSDRIALNDASADRDGTDESGRNRPQPTGNDARGAGHDGD